MNRYAAIAIAVSILLVGALVWTWEARGRVTAGLYLNALEENRSCPRKITDDITIDGFEAGDRRLTERFTITGYGDSRWKAFEERVVPVTRQKMKDDPTVRALLDQGVRYVCIYSDERKTERFRFTVEK